MAVPCLSNESARRRNGSTRRNRVTQCSGAMALATAVSGPCDIINPLVRAKGWRKRFIHPMMIGLGFPAESVAKIIEGMTGPAWNTVSVSTNPMNLGAILLLLWRKSEHKDLRARTHEYSRCSCCVVTTTAPKTGHVHAIGIHLLTPYPAANSDDVTVSAIIW